MGKTKRQRQKLHLSVTNKEPKSEIETNPEVFHPSPLLRVEGDLFKDIDINFDNLTTDLVDDDRRSVKSFKSVKSELTDNNNRIIPKKHKLKLRRELFLKKIDSIQQLKKERQLKLKKKITAHPENANLLDDVLPSLKSLVHTSTVKQDKSIVQPAKPKGIQKAKKRRKEMVKEINIYKKVLSNEQFKANSMAAIAEHIKAVCQQ